MSFSWQGTHISKLGIIASAESLPLLPAPRTATQELPARDGFLDFTEFNPAGRAHFLPRDWRFVCSLEMLPGDRLTERLGELAAMFITRKGRLEVDACPGVWWDAIVTNRFDMALVARNLRQVSIFFRSQPFARSTDADDERLYVWSGMPYEP